MGLSEWKKEVGESPKCNTCPLRLKKEKVWDPPCKLITDKYLSDELAHVYSACAKMISSVENIGKATHDILQENNNIPKQSIKTAQKALCAKKENPLIS